MERTERRWQPLLVADCMTAWNTCQEQTVLLINMAFTALATWFEAVKTMPVTTTTSKTGLGEAAPTVWKFRMKWGSSRQLIWVDSY